MWFKIFVEGQIEKRFLEAYLKQTGLTDSDKVEIFTLEGKDKTRYEKIEKFISQKRDKTKSKILAKYIKTHGEPTEMVLVDYDVFKDKHQPNKLNYFFSKPYFEEYLLKLFQQNFNPNDSCVNLKEKFRIN